MHENSQQRHSIEELSTLVEMPLRTVRYYIQLGLVDRPIGEKKAAYYTATHVDQLLTIRKWQKAGVSLDRIREILATPAAGLLPPPRPRGAGTVEVWSHLVVAEGLEITLEPSRAGLSSDEVRALFQGIASLYKQIKEGQNHDNI
jgi:DNA-binding transcriptional MerR regulator